MKKAFKSLSIFASGLFAGIALAQALIILYNRSGGTFGGELLVLWMIPGLIYVGYTISKDIRIHIARSRIFNQGYDEGYRDGKLQTKWPLHPNCRHSVSPYVKEEQPK